MLRSSVRQADYLFAREDKSISQQRELFRFFGLEIEKEDKEGEAGEENPPQSEGQNIGLTEERDKDKK